MLVADDGGARRNRIDRGNLCVMAFGLILAVATNSRGAPVFEVIGNRSDSWAMPKVSADGTTVVAYHTTSSAAQPMVWRRGGLTNLLSPPPSSWKQTYSYPSDVSGNGAVVVGNWAEGPDRFQAIRWNGSDANAMGFLGERTDWSNATAISADGSVIVGDSNTGAGVRLFRWTEQNGMQEFGRSEAAWSEASGISGVGDVVVGTSYYSTDPLIDSFSAFRWTETTGFVDLGSLSGDARGTKATAVSGDGRVVVGYAGYEYGEHADDYQHPMAFRYTDETGLIPIGNFIPTAADYDGSTIVGWGKSGFLEHALIWREGHGLENLAWVLNSEYGVTPSEYLWRATDISADGNVIVGTTHPFDFGETSWVAIVPEPNTRVLLSIVILVMAHARARSQARASRP